ncbi:MAG: tetratricopeptide repeat protein [Kiritimatiellia bacterium]
MILSILRESWLLVTLTVVLFLSPAATRAQDSPLEVQKALSKHLSLGNYLEAVPLLDQMVSWYATSDDSRILSLMENVYFQLGMCHFVLGHFGESRGAFSTYLRKYKFGARAWQAAVYIADTHRFAGALKDSLKAYQFALNSYSYGPDWKADILIAMAKCHLAEENWAAAAPLLLEVFRTAPDFHRRNWAASLLAVSYLKDLNVEMVYDMMPYLLHPQSFASHSVALNMAALEAGDILFADEKYRDALWVYRIVYPHDVLIMNGIQQKERLEQKAARLRKTRGQIRALIQIQEEIGVVEQELKALDAIENYDSELGYRIARAYQETRRYREACELYYSLYQDEIPNRAEECLYLSFFNAAQVQPWRRAVAFGKEYMGAYPGGAYYDTVSLSVGQLFANQQQWPDVIVTLTNALAVSPRHADIVECLFLVGYASFMEEDFTNSITCLTRMNKEYPGNDREADGTYWIAMANLFDRQYEEALSHFDHLIRFFPQSPYVEDAFFRSASCDYGLSVFDRAETKLLAFLDRYPDSKLASETHLMLGDLAATDGRLLLAVNEYQKVPLGDINIEHYNFAAFRCGEILAELKDYDGLITHFDRYLKKNREGSNIPQALYWQGNAWWLKGEKERALAFYRRAMETYGKDRQALGVDLIMDEWVAKLRDAEPALAAQGWRDLRDLLRTASENKHYTLVLRLQRLLLYDPKLGEADKTMVRKNLFNPNNLPYASPAILDLILDESAGLTNDLAALAATRIVDDFPETDSSVAARMFLARLDMQAGDYDSAIRHLTVVREVFAASGEAAEALLLLGDIHLKTRKLDEADKAYSDVLGAKEWRPLWPEALFGRGQTAIKKQDYARAAAYFERIYVMYSGHRNWTAKAYLARAECLERLRERQKAAEILTEMVNLPELAGLPETATARERLIRLKGGS